MHIHMIITGFGEPYLNEKIRIARHNQTMMRNGSHTLTTTAYVYDHSDIPDDLFDEIIRMPGYVGQFIHRLDMNREHTFDRILLLLDDVEFRTDIHAFIHQCEHIMAGGGFGLFQPSLTADSMYSHHHMLMTGSGVPPVDTDFHRGKCFEYFCHYMRPSELEVYKTLFSVETKCMWGIDFIVPQKLRCYLFRDEKIHHWFKGGLIKKIRCFEEMKRVMSIHG